MIVPYNKKGLTIASRAGPLIKERAAVSVDGMVIALFAMLLMSSVPASHSQEDKKQPSQHNQDARTTIDEAAHRHNEHIHEDLPNTYTTEEVGVIERLGEEIPLAASFADEKGQTIALSDFIDQPTLILPIF